MRNVILKVSSSYSLDILLFRNVSTFRIYHCLQVHRRDRVYVFYASFLPLSLSFSFYLLTATENVVNFGRARVWPYMATISPNLFFSLRRPPLLLLVRFTKANHRYRGGTVRPLRIDPRTEEPWLLSSVHFSPLFFSTLLLLPPSVPIPSFLREKEFLDVSSLSLATVGKTVGRYLIRWMCFFTVQMLRCPEIRGLGCERVAQGRECAEEREPRAG